MSDVIAAPAPRSASPAAGELPADIILRAEGLIKRFQMGPDVLRVLDGADLQVRRGEFVAIMGKSGSGKSTLLHILGALDTPDQGQVFIDDEPVFAPPGWRKLRTSPLDVLSAGERRRIQLRRRSVGFVFQMYHLLPELSALNNVLLTRRIASGFFEWLRDASTARVDAVELLQRVGLGERLQHRPAQLSGGERQRVAIARALVHRPALLLADEPTGNLDGEAGRGILQLLRELHGGRQTIILVTHDRNVAQAADRVLLLESGRLRLA